MKNFKSYQVADLVMLKVDDDLPRFARSFLTGGGTPAENGAELPYSLTVRQGFSGLPAKNGWLGFDLCRMAENVLEWKAQYKFSRWKYRLYRMSDTAWQLEIDGDFFSQWVWPFRTVEMILRLLRWRTGTIQFHAAGLFNGRSAVLLLAPSGTGKTLTTLHFLCGGGKIYHDDTVSWKDGKLLPTLKRISFWENRYRNTPEVLPPNMPVLSPQLKRKQNLSRILNKLSGGYLSLGVPIPVAEYWPEGQPPPAPLSGIIALRKGTEFRPVHDVGSAAFLNRILGDMEFQCLPLLRIAELEKLTGFSILGAEAFFQAHRDFVRRELGALPFKTFDVPPRYSRELFESLKREILS